MYTKTVPARQISSWLLAAVLPGAIQLTSGAPWHAVTFTALSCLLLVCIRWTWGMTPSARSYAVIGWLLSVVILGSLCRYAAESWPRGGHKVVTLVLLALAVWNVCKGTSAAARAGALLAWFVLGAYLVFLGGGLKNVEPEWILPQPGKIGADGAVLLLTPAAASIHLNKGEKTTWRLAVIAALCIAAAVITAGVLSPQVASETQNPFYDMLRSLQFRGRAGNFEAFLSAVMTVGWFCLCSVYLSVIGNFVQQVRPQWGRGGVLVSAAAAAAMVLCELHIPGFFLLILATIFWVAWPILALGIERIKKS